MNKSTVYAHGATLSLLALIALCILEEMWLAPLRPGGSWLVIKVVPLFFSLRGVIKKDNYTMQWSSMLILVYFTEGIVRATSDKAVMSARISWLEVLLCLLFFYCTLSYLRPIKKAAKARAQLESQSAP
ncbi:putative membrane protein [Oxalobacteraceae bacterium GrIS 2.11]